MRICVVGAGAIGGLLAARLSVAGHEVSVLARGAHLREIQESGLRLEEADGTVTTASDIVASHEFGELGTPQTIILALKAHQIMAVADQLQQLYGPETVVVPVQNGIPWWYFERHGGPHDGRRLDKLDPDGILARAVPAQRVVASIPYPAAEKTAPGVVRHIAGNKFPVGELDGSKSARAGAISEALSEAGFKARVLTDIRSHIWVKAWGNLAFNPISALTGATLAEICRTPVTRNLAATMMREAIEIAAALDVQVRLTVEKRIAGAEAVGEHKTSMLQDIEARRALEIDALVGVFVELGELVGVETPSISAVYALASLLNEHVQNPNTEAPK